MSSVCVRLIWLAVLFMLSDCPAATSSPSVSELLDKYTQALDSTESFVSSWESSEVVSMNIPSWGMRAHGQRVLLQGEYRTDNKGRSYEKSYRWGYIGGPHPVASRDKARYLLQIIGDGFTYRHNKQLTTPARMAHLNYREKGTRGWSNPDRRTWGYFDRNDTNNLFLGYAQTKARLDRILREAEHISVRQEPEMVNGSPCYVVEAQTECGDVKVWLDSEHGYHPARIRVSVGVGDDIGDPGSPHIITRKEGVTREYRLDHVRFEEVDGIWVPMEAHRKSYVVLGSENGFFDSKSHFKRTKIVLNPDHDALGSFADPRKHPELDPELRNGTNVQLNLGDGIDRTWLDGQIIPPGQSQLVDR